MTSDDQIWDRYAKGVKRLRTIKSPSRTRERPGVGNRQSPPDEPKRRMMPSEGKPTLSHPSVLPARGRGTLTPSLRQPNQQQPTLDRRVERELRRGEITIEARIDLHGMTQEKAYDALARFIAAQVKTGRRNLLIITGKGRSNQGILRTSLPDWIQSLPEAAHILTVRPAAPKHGGDGAFCVLLKKKKE